MRHFCTYFDKQYLTRGVALCASLREHCREPFCLWVLCFDAETYDVMSAMALSCVRLISQEEFEECDVQLAQVKKIRSRIEYYWTCTPSLPLYVFSRDPAIATVTYLDADLFFYSDVKPIFDEFGDGSILIIPHRFPASRASHAEAAGTYNVQFMTFRRDDYGLGCLAWWREKCLEWCSAKSGDGKFGDQKYLDDWPSRFQGVVVLQNNGAGLAPWNMSAYEIAVEAGRLLVDGSPLIFHHFHGLVFGRVVAIAPPKNYRYHASTLISVYLPYLKALRLAAQAVEAVSPGLVSCRMRLSCNALLWFLPWQIFILLKYGLFRQWTWRREQRCARDEALLDHGYVLFQRGQSVEARRVLTAAVIRNPRFIMRPGVAAIIVKSWLNPR